MWGHNPSTYNLGSNSRHVCQTPTMPCLCTCCHARLYDYTYNNPMNQWYNNHLLPHQGISHNNPPLNPIFHGQESMATNQIDPCLLLNPDQNFNQYQGRQFNPQVNHHGNYGDPQQQQQQELIYDFSRAALDDTPASFLNVKASLPVIVPEVTPTVDWSGVDEFSFLPFYNQGVLKEEVVGSNSYSTSFSSEGKQQQQQQLDASNKPSKFLPMSRQDRVLRYFEKKKTRKYEKKTIQYSSRRTYAQTRPRIRGRFARRSEVDTQ